MTNSLKDIPNFETEEEERAFWGNQDTTDYIDWDEAEVVVLPKLEPSTRSISLPLLKSMLKKLRTRGINHR